MHLKMTIADHSIVTVGSYNYTKAAKQKHDDVLVVIEDEGIAKEWTQQFNRMWNDPQHFNEFVSSTSFQKVS